MVILYVTLWRTVNLFSKVAAPFYISTSSVWGLEFFYILTTLVIISFLFLFLFLMAILVSVKWYLIAVLIPFPDG